MFKYDICVYISVIDKITTSQLFLHALWLRRKVLPPTDSNSSASINKEAASRFALADLDGDGQISKQEFESTLQSVYICVLESISISLQGLLTIRPSWKMCPHQLWRWSACFLFRWYIIEHHRIFIDLINIVRHDVIHRYHLLALDAWTMVWWFCSSTK